MKYRAVCPICNKGFDIRTEGNNLDGQIICNNCFEKHVRFRTIEDYIDINKK